MSPQFIGRKSYLKKIQDNMYHIMSGQPRILLLEGEAGIGKSRFLREVMTLCESSGVQVCSGYGADTFSRPYEPFSGLFPALQSEGVFSAEQYSTVALESGVATGTLYESTFDRAASDQIRLMIDVTNASFALAREAPLIIIADDLHFADAASLELFDYLASELVERRDVPILLLGSHRPAMADTALATLLSRLRKHPILDEIKLGYFGEFETQEMMEVLAHQDVTQQLVDHVLRVTRGVPFYIEQLMLHLSHQGALANQASYLGLKDVTLGNVVNLHTPEGMINPRLDSLPDNVYDILTVGAFLLEPFSDQMLSHAAETEIADIEHSCRIARVQGLLVRESDSLRFSHALVRQVLQNRLSLDQRQRAHFRIACALERLEAESLNQNILIIAHHIVQAGPLVEVKHAVAVMQQAGEQAMRVYAWGEAARYFEAACASMESCVDPRQGDLASYYYQAAVMHYRNQDVGPAFARFEQAVEAYKESGDRLGLGSALMWLTRLGFTCASTPFGVLPLSAQPLRDLLTELGDSEASLRGYFLETLSIAYRHGRQTDEANEMAQMALAIGEKLDDPHLKAKASCALATACASRLDIELAIENHIIAVDSARQANDLILESQTLSNVPLAHFLIGDFESTQSTAAAAAETTRMLQDWSEYSKSLSHLAGVAAVRGDFETVEQLAEKSLVTARRSRYPWGAYRALQTWAFVLAVRGLPQEADEVLDMIIEPGSIFRTPGNYEILLTGILRQLAHLYQGEVLNQPITSLCDAFCQSAKSDTYSLGPLCATIELAELTHNPSLIEVPLIILSRAFEKDVLFTSGWVFSIPRVLGIAAVLRQEWERAAAYFAQAMSLTIEAMAWPEYGRVCLDYARMILFIRDERNYPQAIKAARKGTDLMREYGMLMHVRRGRKLLEALTIGMDVNTNSAGVSTENDGTLYH